MANKPKRDQPKTTPQAFEQTIKALAKTPPISNEDIVKRSKGK